MTLVEHPTPTSDHSLEMHYSEGIGGHAGPLRIILTMFVVIDLYEHIRIGVLVLYRETIVELVTTLLKSGACVHVISITEDNEII